MKRLNVVAALLVMGLLASAPVVAQYGAPSMGGGLGGSNDTPPPPAPPGSIGNPPPKAKPVKYFDGSVAAITGNVLTIEQVVVVPGESAPVVVTKTFEFQTATQYDPTDWKVGLKQKVRVIYEPKDDKLVVTKVILDKPPGEN